MKKPFYKKWWFFAIIAFLIIGIALSPSDEEKETEIVAAEQEKPKKEKAEVVMTNEDKVNTIIIDKLGDKNNMKKERIVESKVFEFTDDPKGEKNIIVILNASENMSNKLTRKSMWMDSVKILEPFSSIEGVQNISIEWLFPLVDQHGNETDSRIMLFDFPKEVFEKVNWDNFNADNIPNVSEGYFEHPALSK